MLWLALPAIAIEAGWLALWPLSVALSHSPAFTADFVSAREPVARLLEVTQHVAQRLLPGLPTAPMVASEALGSDGFIQSTVALVWVLVWLSAAYFAGLIVLGRWLGRYPSATLCVVGAALFFQVTRALLPGLFSQDVFS